MPKVEKNIEKKKTSSMDPKDKKSLIVIGIMVLIIIAGSIITVVVGLNKDVTYSDHTSIIVNIGKSFEMKDIKQIAKEVFKGQSVKIQVVEVYKESVSISVKQASEEQISELNTKLNEKYEIDNKLENEDLLIYYHKSVRFYSIVKPYILPYIIATAIIFLFLLFKFKKSEPVKRIVELTMVLVLVQGMLFALAAITRIPVDRYIMTLSVFVYIIVLLIYTIKTEQVIEEQLEEEIKKNKSKKSK